MIKTLKRTISSAIQSNYELSDKALEALSKYDKNYSTKRFTAYDNSDMLQYLSGPLQYLNLEDEEHFFGPDVLSGKYLYLQRYITITTNNFADSFSSVLMLSAENNDNVQKNIISFLNYIVDNANKIGGSNSKQLIAFAIRSIFLSASDKSGFQFGAIYALISAYIDIVSAYLNIADMQLNDQVLNDSFVKSIKAYIDYVYNIVKAPWNPKTSVCVDNFSSFLKLITEKFEKALEKTGQSDILEQFKQNIRDIFSKDTIDKINEISDTYVKTVGPHLPNFIPRLTPAGIEAQLKCISGPLDNLLKVHRIQTN